MKNSDTLESTESRTAAGVGTGDLVQLLRDAAQEQRGYADQCIHAPKAKAGFLEKAKNLDLAVANLERLLAAERKLIDIVDGARAGRWALNGQRLTDTPEWCAFYVAHNHALRS